MIIKILICMRWFTIYINLDVSIFSAGCDGVKEGKTSVTLLFHGKFDAGVHRVQVKVERFDVVLFQTAVTVIHIPEPPFRSTG